MKSLCSITTCDTESHHCITICYRATSITGKAVWKRGSRSESFPLWAPRNLGKERQEGDTINARPHYPTQEFSSKPAVCKASLSLCWSHLGKQFASQISQALSSSLSPEFLTGNTTPVPPIPETATDTMLLGTWKVKSNTEITVQQNRHIPLGSAFSIDNTKDIKLSVHE